MASLWEVRNATVRVDGRALLEDVSLRVTPGRLIGALGPNGAGKSTLLRLASGALRPDEGEVLLDEKPMSAYSRRQIARRIAMVPQDTHVEFDFSAYDIALMGRNPRLSRFQWPSHEDHRIVRQAMELTETSGFASQLVTTLSGGERQRVFLARALATESSFIALDEPTANLDIEHALSFFHLARTLVDEKERGILMAIHDLNWAYRFCDEVVLLSKGKIVERGAPADTLTPKRIRQVFRVEAESLQTASGETAFTFKTAGRAPAK
jgi:iron complex transport system ATP-binding protein